MRCCISHSPPPGQMLRVSPSENLHNSQLLSKEVVVPKPSQLLPTMGMEQAQRAAGTDCSTGQKRRVVFADSKGLSLTAVCIFTAEEVMPCPKLTLRPRQPVSLRVAPSAGSTGRGPGSLGKRRVWLGFPQPSSDFQAFRAQLQGALVALESCAVTERALSGTVLVRNVSYEKDVRLRVTFDSWRSHRDVPCVYLHQGYCAPDTDAFSFSIHLPVSPDPRDRLEFCVSYQPGGYDAPLWDNNGGQNYRIHMEPEGADCSSEPGHAPPTNHAPPALPCALRHLGTSQPEGADCSSEPGHAPPTLPCALRHLGTSQPEGADCSSEPGHAPPTSHAPPTLPCALRHLGTSQPWSWRAASDRLTLSHAFSCPDFLMGHCWDILENTAPFW